VAFRLFPREESFFDLLEKAAKNLKQASNLLTETLRNPADLAESARLMKALEDDGDAIVHEVMDKLHNTFITPLDREDIHNLISVLDDVLDNIEAAVDRFALYRARPVSAHAIELGDIIARQTDEINTIIPFLRRIRREDIVPHCVELNRLENVADSTLRRALEDLFASPSDTIKVLQWKELYETLEAATDKAEDVADLVEGIVLKNA
jgi:uncharacterized protein Yka (UPF0111/DUF47 family)